MNAKRLLLLLGALCVAVAGGPFLFGLGVDVPDDALYYVVSDWEWHRWALGNGANPWINPGKMGGANVFTDSLQMGPVYPAMWTVAFLPVAWALPLAFVVHCIGSVFAVRWLAGTHGASPTAATVAGLSFATGAVGLTAFIETQSDIWSVYVFFPLILGCARRLELSPERAERLKWTLLGGLAMAAMLSGAHVRHAAGTCAAVGVWYALRARFIGWWMATTLIGVLGGAIGFLPALMELPQAEDPTAGTSAMALPPFQVLNWTVVSSWLAARPFVTSREFGPGVILGVTFLVGAFRLKGGRLLAVHTAILLLAAAALPVVRWILAPLTLLAHPTLIVYYALAMVPAAIVGALGLDAAAKATSEDLRRYVGGPVGIGLVVLLVSIVARILLASSDFASPWERMVYLGVAGKAFVVVAIFLFVVSRSAVPPQRRLTVLAAVALVDLAVSGVVYHRAVPSEPLDLRSREAVDGEEILAGGYLHIGEMAVLAEDGLDIEHSLQSAISGDHPLDFDEFQETGEVEDLAGEAENLQRGLLQRRWPAHLGSARGIRSISGRVKLPPYRQVAALLPLARQLGGAADPWSHFDPEGELVEPPPNDQVFAEDGLGGRTMALHGVPIAVGEDGSEYRVSGLAPRCYSPRRFEVEGDTKQRVRRLLEQPFDPDLGIVESNIEPSGTAQVGCDPDGLAISVSADGDSVVVLRERYHPGWEVWVDGRPADAFPVNQVHAGVLVPSGEHIVQWRFRAPMLREAAILAALVYLLCGGALWRLRRRATPTVAPTG